ncbi:hypothetical protein P5E99_15890, partial [Clostridium perfringens]|nr:hypothetical protein [Clostridium perfringens]
MFINCDVYIRSVHAGCIIIIHFAFSLIEKSFSVGFDQTLGAEFVGDTAGVGVRYEGESCEQSQKGHGWRYGLK